MVGSLRMLGMPRMYIQGAGAIDQLGELLAPLPAPFVIILDEFVHGLLAPRIAAAVEKQGFVYRMQVFAGECTRSEIERLTGGARSDACASVVGIGGGKTLDAAKGVAKRLGLPLAIVPTVASNDAPTSRLIVVYDEQHAIADVERLSWNPDIVVVDSQVIAEAPTRFLRAGIGDAISKRFEAEQVRRSGGRNFFNTAPLESARSFAELAYETILNDAEQALRDCELHRVTPALERLIEAAVLASGAGFENGGLSIAHALTRGLTAAESTRGALHGEMVAYGLLIQLRLTAGAEVVLEELLSFYQRIGLPCRLDELGAQGDIDIQIALIGERTGSAPHAAHFERRLSAADITAAIRKHERQITQA